MTQGADADGARGLPRYEIEIDTESLAGLELWEAAEGLDTVISLRMPHPSIDGPTRDKLAPSPEIINLVKNLAIEVMSRFCDEHPHGAEDIVRRIIGSR